MVVNNNYIFNEIKKFRKYYYFIYLFILKKSDRLLKSDENLYNQEYTVVTIYRTPI